MPAAGDYGSRLRWLQLSTAADDTGDSPQTYVPVGFLWASVDETNGRRQDEAGATQTGVDAEIRVRNYPAVLATDLLEDTYLGYVWHLDSIRNGNDELIIDAYRNDTLLNFTIEELS